jgi:ADP-ribosyl-[dinitrogen reductase] hydrolase
LRDVEGGGPFGVEAGQVTDDTQMAVCLSDSLLERGGFDAEDAAARYVAWREHAFDIGSQTSAALALVRDGYSAAGAGKCVWIERARVPAGNGSLMRTAPIGVFVADEQARRVAALAESAITHFDPRCQLACAAFNAAIAAGIRGADATGMAEVADAELDAAAAALGEPLADEVVAVAEARRVLRVDLVAARADDPQLYGPELHLLDQEGFVRVAFRLAFWHLQHTSDPARAIVDVANRGGDADTNAAIVGALLGACHGAGAIPVAWQRRVLDALQGRTPSALSTTYHPRRFLRALESWRAQSS